MVYPVTSASAPPKNIMRYGAPGSPNAMAAPEAAFPWVKDANIQAAIRALSKITFDPQDAAYVRSIGANMPFNSGAEALDFLRKSNARIVFDKLSSPEVHAQYDFDKNFIRINETYRDTLNTAEILAIAEAILHEAGHAKDGDNASSLQEEIDCLAMNVLAHRYIQRQYPHMFSNSSSRIVQDGVSIYEKLFFDPDPNKKALVERLQDKYGYLPLGDRVHPPSQLAMKVKDASALRLS